LGYIISFFVYIFPILLDNLISCFWNITHFYFPICFELKN